MLSRRKRRRRGGRVATHCTCMHVAPQASTPPLSSRASMLDVATQRSGTRITHPRLAVERCAVGKAARNGHPGNVALASYLSFSTRKTDSTWQSDVNTSHKSSRVASMASLRLVVVCLVLSASLSCAAPCHPTHTMIESKDATLACAGKVVGDACVNQGLSCKTISALHAPRALQRAFARLRVCAAVCGLVGCRGPAGV